MPLLAFMLCTAALAACSTGQEPLRIVDPHTHIGMEIDADLERICVLRPSDLPEGVSTCTDYQPRDVSALVPRRAAIVADMKLDDYWMMMSVELRDHGPHLPMSTEEARRILEAELKTGEELGVVLDENSVRYELHDGLQVASCRATADEQLENGVAVYLFSIAGEAQHGLVTFMMLKELEHEAVGDLEQIALGLELRPFFDSDLEEAGGEWRRPGPPIELLAWGGVAVAGLIGAVGLVLLIVRRKRRTERSGG